MYLKIIWENGSEALVECSRVVVTPVLLDRLPNGDAPVTIEFQAIDYAHRMDAVYRVSPEALVHVFVMNDAGDTIENWHSDRRTALALHEPDRSPKPDLTVGAGRS